MKKIKFLVLALSILSSKIFAQLPSSATQAQLKTACETSAGNVVTLSQSTKVSMPVVTSTPTDINCPCKFVLLNGSTLELEQVNVKFAGALTIESVGKGEFKAIKSNIEAAATTVSLLGEGSSVQTSQSKIKANTGNISIAMGAQPKVELYGAFGQFGTIGFEANGAASFTGGTRSLFSIVDMAVIANQNITIKGTGEETLMKVERVGFSSKTGNLNIEATGNKGLLEMIESNSFVYNSTNINFAGDVSGLKLNEVGFFGTTQTASSIGGVSITSGSGTANSCKVEMSDISTGVIAGAFTVNSCVAGQFGNIKLEKSTIRSGGDMTFKTGATGSTEIKENRITSLTKIDISTGAGGKCLSTPNFLLSAPIVNSCVGAVIKASSDNNATVKNQMDCKLYPNPGTSLGVTLELSGEYENLDHNINVFDMQGRLVQNWNNYDSDYLKINDLPKGFYSVRILNNKTGQKDTKKLVIVD